MEEVYFSQVNLVFLTFQNLTSSTVLSVLAVLLKELLVGNRKKKKRFGLLVCKQKETELGTKQSASCEPD